MNNTWGKKCVKFGLAIGITAALAFSLQAVAKPPFLKTLKEVYPDSDPKCTTCHVKGKELNPYGIKFSKEPEFKTDSAAALKKIGKP